MATDESADDPAALLGWLADRDVACPLCGYNLRGLTAARCPECGQPLRLSVALTDPYLKAWIVTAASLLLPAGLGLLWMVLVPIKGWPRGREANAVVPILYQVAAIPLAVIAVLGRRRFQRWPRHRQRGVAAVAVVACVVSFGLIFLAFA